VDPRAWLVLLVGLAGCVQLPPEGRRRLIEADRQYEQGHYRTARDALSGLIQAYPDRAEIAEAYYVRGLCHLKLNRRTAAREDFEQALRRSNRQDLTARVHACLGSLAYEQGDFAQAIDHYQQAIPDLPDKPPLDEVLYRLGVSLQRVGRWDDARAAFSKLFWKFPGSRIEPDARRRFRWPYEYFVIQCGAFERLRGAEDLMRQLSQKGLRHTQWRLETRRSKVIYVVQVGRYKDYAAAKADLPTVRRIVSDAFIAP